MLVVALPEPQSDMRSARTGSFWLFDNLATVAI
jgi:hypothetical protein